MNFIHTADGQIFAVGEQYKKSRQWGWYRPPDIKYRSGRGNGLLPIEHFFSADECL